MRCLVSGSSHRRGSRGWTDAVAIRRFLLAIRDAGPVIIEGESPYDGADKIVRVEAERLGILVDPCPIDRRLDGYDRPAPIRRNIRMEATKHPQVGAAFVVGNVGESVGTKGHYLSNGTDHMVSLLRAHGKAVVVYREDGVEPCRDIGEAFDVLRGLYRAGLYREDVCMVGLAVKAATDAGEIVAARAAVEALRLARPTLAPWLAPVEMVLAA